MDNAFQRLWSCLSRNARRKVLPGFELDLPRVLERFPLVRSTPAMVLLGSGGSMAPYSMDLRSRVLRDSDAGMPSKEVAVKYAVSRAWVDRVKQRRRERGEIAPRTQTVFRPRVLAGHEDRIIAVITAHPDATLLEIREALRLAVGLSTLWREIDRLGFRVKKNGLRRRTAPH
jgi:transposase